jgi:hypothetical protein
MLSHAINGIEAGAASHILILGGDVTSPQDFVKRVISYNSATRDHLAPLDYGGPNALFAMLTKRQIKKHGLVPRTMDTWRSRSGNGPPGTRSRPTGSR